jgi:3-hydroxybutyrate dehydrogenase
VVILDLDQERVHAAAADLGAQALTADLSDLAAVDALQLDVDIVVNNAGFQHVAPIPEFPPEIFGRLQRIMVEAPFRLVRQVLPGMYRRGWGRIVNISSVHGLRASPYKVAYVTAKHGLEGLSKVIALEGAEHGVTSNCVNPAYVRTPLVQNQIQDQAREHGLEPDQVIEQVMLARAAIRRLIEPAEVAELVAYLCSPPASMITGSSLTLDGGWTAY